MTYDLKIKGGTIHDGGGGAPFSADIAVKDGIIVEIGAVTAPAAREIEADGLLVTPGFIDPHTHYDAQAFWDSDLETSVRHGVTTAIGGNCGVGFAPLRPRERDNLISLMAGVEDIPANVLAEGLAWDWSSFGEYLDRLGAVARPIDIGGNVPHDCIRLFVMGERAAAQEAASADDIVRMKQVLKESLEAGAVGFSFGRVFGHKTADGRQTPSYNAEPDELVALAGVLRELPYRVLQGVTDGRVAEGPDAFDREYGIVRAMVAAADRPVSLNLHRRSEPAHSRNAWTKVMATADAPNGNLIRFQVNAKAAGSFYGLTSSINLLSPFPSYRAIAALPLKDRVARLGDPALRTQLLREEPIALPNDPPGIASAIRVIGNLDAFAERIYPLAAAPDYEPGHEASVAATAKARGITALAAIYDLCLDDEGEMLLDHPRMNYVEGNLDNLRTMLTHSNSFFGVGDAGAHLGYVCDVGFPTLALSFWARDRRLGDKIPLPLVVHKMTGKVADHFGFADRGRIRVGLRADLNLIDYDTLRLFRPRCVTDLPAGGRRFLQHAQGYRAVMVAGVPILENDEPTGAKPGRLLRGLN